MQTVEPQILIEALAGTAEPLLIVSVDQPDWPIAFANAAFESIRKGDVQGQPFADVVESLGGRELALEVSESVRLREETSIPVESASREYLLILKPVGGEDDTPPSYYAAYWRSAANLPLAQSAEMHHALLKAKRQIRDLSRDDPVTGLLNARAFRDVFEHDWAVATREKTMLSLVSFRLDEFSAYVDVFGPHAADSCLRKVGHTIRRCLRRASDVVGRTDAAVFIALSHASEEANVREFAARIATDVRELGLHHPRSSASKFVTVTPDVSVADDANEAKSASEFLDSLLERIAE